MSLLCNGFDIMIIVMRENMPYIIGDKEKVIKQRIREYFASYHKIYNEKEFIYKNIIA